jgi:hypothetical protein
MKSDLTFCPHCEEDSIKERIADLQVGHEYEEGYDEDSIKEMMEDEGEIELCSYCYHEEQADMDRDEY